jgi:hypothetical protein
MKFETLNNHSFSPCSVVLHTPSSDQSPAKEDQKMLLLLSLTKGD